MKWLEEVKRLIKDESAIAGVEYALLVALIGAAIATASPFSARNRHPTLTR